MTKVYKRCEPYYMNRVLDRGNVCTGFPVINKVAKTETVSNWRPFIVPPLAIPSSVTGLDRWSFFAYPYTYIPKYI